jgi:hypothetical protein
MMKLLNVNPKLQRKPVILLSFMLFWIHIFVSHPLTYAKITKPESDSSLTKDSQQQINQSYRVFNNDLNQLSQEIEQVSKEQKSAQSIRVSRQLQSLNNLQESIKNWQPINQSFLVENELNRMIKGIDNIQFVLEIIDNEGITTNSLYQIQRKVGIRGQGNLEQQFNNLLTYLDEENKKITISLDEINKNSNTFDTFKIIIILLIIIITLVVFWFIYQLRTKPKYLPSSSESNQKNLEKLLSEMVKQEIDQKKLSLPKDNPLLLENSEEIKELVHKIVAELVEQQPKQELPENKETPSENLPLASSSENLVNPEQSTPINSDRFIPLYEAMVNDYNNNNFESYQRIRVSQILDQTFHIGQILPRFQPANNGLYCIIKIKIECYLIPIPNVIINQHNQKSFTNVFDCFSADFHHNQRFNLLKPAIVIKNGEQWELKEKGVLQFEQL